MTTNEPTGAELSVTQGEIDRWVADSGIKAVTAKRLFRVMQRLGIDEFATADKAAWNETYHKCMESGTDLGKTGLKVFEDCARFIKERKFQKKLEIRKQEKARAEEAAMEAELAKKAAEDEKRINPKFTRAQMKKVADFMEMEDIPEVDLRWVNDFFKMFPKEEQPKED